jgi:hypothetical protein
MHFLNLQYPATTNICLGFIIIKLFPTFSKMMFVYLLIFNLQYILKFNSNYLFPKKKLKTFQSFNGEKITLTEKKGICKTSEQLTNTLNLFQFYFISTITTYSQNYEH